jgi:hypothetical protein
MPRTIPLKRPLDDPGFRQAPALQGPAMPPHQRRGARGAGPGPEHCGCPGSDPQQTVAR